MANKEDLVFRYSKWIESGIAHTTSLLRAGWPRNSRNEFVGLELWKPTGSDFQIGGMYVLSRAQVLAFVVDKHGQDFATELLLALEQTP